MMRVTIIGFGNQAKAWAQNLQDSHFPVTVALRAGSPSFDAAKRAGVPTVEIGSKEFYEGEAFALLTPDHTHHEFMLSHGDHFHKNSVILYAHGFSLLQSRFHENYSQLRHVLFAPKSIGSELRNQYLIKGKLGAVYSFEHCSGDMKQLQEWLFKLSHSLGINMGPYKTSFQKETEADLYSEQGLLCSLIPYTAREMFNHLVESGTEPELAYFECWHEMKLIVNAMIDKGPKDFFDLISPNALIGSEKGFERLVNPDFQSNLKGLLTDIQSGTFNSELEKTDVQTVRNIIRSRWEKDPLQKAFEKINHQESK